MPLATIKCIVIISVLTDRLILFLYTREYDYSDAKLCCGGEMAYTFIHFLQIPIRNMWLQSISTIIYDNYSLTLSFLQHI